jgi:2-polyprenyl-3-methyl-5-hydroxy-6-metoxy-1,4-benzoquinol methylase
MARIYDPDNREAALLADLVSFEGLEVLDVGCGEGRTSRTIARTAAAVTGVDPDVKRIDVARSTDPEPGSCPITFLAEEMWSSAARSDDCRARASVTFFEMSIAG